MKLPTSPQSAEDEAAGAVPVKLGNTGLTLVEELRTVVGSVFVEASDDLEQEVVLETTVPEKLGVTGLASVDETLLLVLLEEDGMTGLASVDDMGADADILL